MSRSIELRYEPAKSGNQTKLRLSKYPDVGAKSEKNKDHNDGLDQIYYQDEGDLDLDGFIVADNASLEFDSDFRASDGGTPRLRALGTTPNKQLA